MSDVKPMIPCYCGSTSIVVWCKKNPMWADHAGYYHASIRCLECGHEIMFWHPDRSEAIARVLDLWNGGMNE